MTTAAAAWAQAMSFAHRADPYPYFAELRKTPVARVADDLYVVTGYPELLALSHDPRISSDVRRGPRGAAQPAATAEPAAADPAGYGSEPSLIVTDPPSHDKARRQVARHFASPHSPDLIPGMEPAIVALCNDLLDRTRESGRTRIDVVDDYAYPVPVMVICKILGVPLADEPRFHAWIFDMLAGVDLGPDAATDEGQQRGAKAREAQAALRGYLADLIASGSPGLLTELVEDTSGPDGPMPADQALANAVLLLIAGHDSTVNTISNCVLTLLRNPGTFELLRDRPELIPRAIEEVQRLQSAVQFFPSRSATADIEIAGTVIPQGAAVHLLYGAANRDPRRFPDPDRFDIFRPDNEHFGWGSGIHTCVGGPLARLEVNLALEIFLARVRGARLVADPPPYRQSQIFRGPRHVVIDIEDIARAGAG